MEEEVHCMSMIIVVICDIDNFWPLMGVCVCECVQSRERESSYSKWKERWSPKEVV